MTDDVLVRAADRLAALVDASESHGPFRVMESDVDGPPDCTVWQVGVDGEVSEEYAMGCYRGDAAYIAAMSPPVARALVDWLRQTAADHTFCVCNILRPCNSRVAAGRVAVAILGED